MKKLSFGLLSILLISCSHQRRESNKSIQFSYAAELLEKVQKENQSAPSSVQDNLVSEKSPRRVYFSTLYYQYLALADHLGKKSEMSFCPQFHHDRIETDSTIVPKFSLYNSPSIESEGRDYFPELAFDKKFSLKDYHKVIKSELEILCEEGISDNFYKFENLVTHYSNNKSFHQNPKAMISVLKIPVFANFYLVKMLEVQGARVSLKEEKRFIQLTNTYWFDSYVAQAGRMRSKFIKNKMVGR